MQIYYPSGCDDVVSDHYCNPCDPQEGARVRSVFFVKKGFEFVNISNPVEWAAAIAAGNVIVVAETNGSFDGGTPKLAAGFGDTIETYINSEFKLTFKDPNYKNNCTFYEGLKTTRNWRVGFRTQTLVHLADVTAIITPKAPVADDLQGQVTWEVEAKWISRNYPCPQDVPAGVFDECFMVS